MNKPFMAPFTAEYLRARMKYDPITGIFTSRVGSPKALGFRSKTGYVDIDVGQRTFRAHRLAWLYMTGEWPSKTIDHVNRIRNDNRFSNLRLATRSQQCVNRLSTLGIAGLRGVKKGNTKKETWIARLHVGGGEVHLGTFTCRYKAHEAYVAATVSVHGDFLPQPQIVRA